MSIFRLIAGSQGNAKAWDLAYAEFNGTPVNWFYVGTQDSLSEGIFFKPDGSKMYVVGNFTESVYEYDLSTPWDISSASYSQNISVASQDSSPQGLFFKPDGAKMYVVGTSNDAVYEYDLSTPWDISSASYSQNFSVSSQDTIPEGVFFKPDGSKMYVTGSSGDEVNEYDLSTPWDISSASYSQNFSVSAQEADPSGVFFKPDGSKMYVTGSSGDEVNEYDLSTPWDISSASYSQNFSVSAQETTPLGLFFKPDGTKMYIIGSSRDTVYEYNLSTPWDVSSASWVEPTDYYYDVSAQETGPQGFFFKPDGSKMYVVGSSGDEVTEYDLSTPWGVSSASYLQNFSVATQETGPTGLFFKPDGTKMYVVGTTGDDVNEYDLSTAWDISSASYSQNFSVSAQETSPQGIFFKPDGAKMYVVGTSNDAVYEYDLSTPWDVSSASYSQNFSVSAQEAGPQGFFFKPDGSKMYVVGTSNDAVYEYDLSTPWDVSSASYSQNFSVSSQDIQPRGIFFKPDGSKMYVVGTFYKVIYEYTFTA